MAKKVTLKDIAAAAGLSPASVSMILNHRSGGAHFYPGQGDGLYQQQGQKL